MVDMRRRGQTRSRPTTNEIIVPIEALQTTSSDWYFPVRTAFNTTHIIVESFLFLLDRYYRTLILRWQAMVLSLSVLWRARLRPNKDTDADTPDAEDAQQPLPRNKKARRRVRERQPGEPLATVCFCETLIPRFRKGGSFSWHGQPKWYSLLHEFGAASRYTFQGFRIS